MNILIKLQQIQINVLPICHLQFPIGSTMNPIRLKEYEDYKKVQKNDGKEFQWHEFLKLNKSQYLNFRASIL